MKQLELTDNLKQKLRKTAGENVNLDNFAVFKASALTTLPVRKKHPVFYGGVHTRTFLSQMKQFLDSESLPLQIMHDGEGLPSGRVFDSAIVDYGNYSALDTYFWVDKTTTRGIEYINSINNGTVDQVSVAILAKSAVSNKTGFDFLGSEATVENIWTGTDPDGNVMGENGAHVLVNDLDKWYEMSLVGQGGAVGAKIHAATGHLKLAASGLDAPPLTLTLSSEKPKQEQKETETMTDLTPFIKDLTETKTALALAERELADLTTRLAEVQAKVTELTAANTSVAETQGKLTEATTQVETLSTALKDVFTHVSTMVGNATQEVPEAVETLVSTVKENIGKLKLVGKPQGMSLDSSAGTGEADTPRPGNSAFKRNR